MNIKNYLNKKLVDVRQLTFICATLIGAAFVGGCIHGNVKYLEGYEAGANYAIDKTNQEWINVIKKIK